MIRRMEGKGDNVVSSHGGGDAEARQLSEVSFIRALIPFMKSLLIIYQKGSDLIISSKTLPFNTTTLAFTFQHMNLRGAYVFKP
jgi:hypothetical protein